MSNFSLNKIKPILFFIVMFLLWMPLLQNTFVFFNEEPLGGAINNVEKPFYSYDSFLAGEYQNQLEEYQKSSFGFRNTMIRLNNQKMYSLYNIAKANGAVIGKQGYLLNEDCIYSYTGSNFVGNDVINKNVEQLQKVRTYLNSLDKDIIFVIAPGKGSFFPEYIPDKYLKTISKNTNYQAYVSAFNKHNINYIDFKKWFLENKNISKYPLYPKCGIHWSKYGEYFVADSLIKHIELKRAIDLPELVMDSLVLSKKNLFEDYDVGEGLNLLIELNTYEMAYPFTHVQKNDNNKLIKTLVVGDSYYWGLFNREISHQIFDQGEFWYYNKQIYSYFLSGTYIEDVDLKKTIDENELFILFFTEANLVNFDYGFTNMLYNFIFNKTQGNGENRVQFYIDRIKSSPEWLAQIQKQAEELKRPLDELIRENAMFMVRKEQLN